MIIKKINKPLAVILAVLAVAALALLLIPARALAATNIALSGGVPTEASGTNWTYDSGTLTVTGDCTAGTSADSCTVAVVVQGGGSLSGGYYSGTVDNHGRINNGTFSGSVTNRSGATIAGGTFSGVVTNNDGATITGGTFTNSVKPAFAYYVVFGGGHETTGGSTPRQTFYYGTSQQLSPNSFLRAGYEFVNWKRDDSTYYNDMETVGDLTDTAGSHISLQAQWSIKTYTISYDLAEGSATNLPESYTVETADFTLPIPTRTGYDFAGWTGNGIATPQSVTIAKGSVGSRNYTANWRAATYNVTLDSNGGTANGSAKATYESASLTAIDAPTFAGYEPTGYYTAASGGTLLADASGALVANVSGYTDAAGKWIKTGGDTLYPRWQKVTYSITYDLDEGSATNLVRSYDVDSPAITLPTPTKTGCTFTGWSGTGLTGDGNTSVTIPAGSTGNRSYTAHWQPDTCAITLNKNGGAADGSVTASYGSALASFAALTRTGYDLTGYFTAQSGGTKLIEASGALTPGVSGYTNASGRWVKEGNDGLVLYAQWTPRTDIAYKVEHYVMDIAGHYPASPTNIENKEGTADALLTLSALANSGLSVDGGIEYRHGTVNGSEASSTDLKPDGSLTVKLYYERIRHSLRLTAGEGVISVSPTNLSNYYYGETVSIDAETENGKVWQGWMHTTGGSLFNRIKQCTFTMPQADLALTAVAANTSFNISMPPELRFDARTVGYSTPPAASAINVINEGNSTVVINSIASPTNFVLGGSFPLIIAAGDSGSFTLRPKEGLTARDYIETITVTTAQGTSASTSVRFLVNPVMTVGITGDAEIELGQSASLTANVTGGTGAYSYIWSNSPASHTASMTDAPTNGTVYTVQVTDQGGGRAEASATVLVRQAAPAAVFTATDESAGTLSAVNIGMQYSLDGGANWAGVSGSSMALTGVTVRHGVQVRRMGSTGLGDSRPQTITVTKANVPTLQAQQPAVSGQKGAIPMTRGVHEYRQSGSAAWVTATGTTEFAVGTYEVRVKASGTMLASGPQTIEIKVSPRGGVISVTHPIVYNNSNNLLADIWVEGDGLNSNDLLISRELLSGSDYEFMLELAGDGSVYRVYDMFLASGLKYTGLPMYMSFKLDPAYAGQSVFTLAHKRSDGMVEYFYSWANAAGVVEFGPFYELSPFMLVRGRLDRTVLYVSTDIPRTGEAFGGNAGVVALAAASAVILGSAAIYLTARRGRSRGRDRRCGGKHEN